MLIRALFFSSSCTLTLHTQSLSYKSIIIVGIFFYTIIFSPFQILENKSSNINLIILKKNTIKKPFELVASIFNYVFCTFCNIHTKIPHIPKPLAADVRVIEVHLPSRRHKWNHSKLYLWIRRPSVSFFPSLFLFPSFLCNLLFPVLCFHVPQFQPLPHVNIYYIYTHIFIIYTHTHVYLIFIYYYYNYYHYHEVLIREQIFNKCLPYLQNSTTKGSS